MGLGAPTVLVEKVPAGPEPVYALEALEREVGHTFDALIPSEAGGWNSLHPMLPAAQRHIPLLDADGMGRAFPELQMVTWSMYGQSASPIGVADERGNTLLVHAATNKCGEDLCRGATVEMGGNISLACYGMTGAEAKAHSVAGTYTLCENVGRILRRAREERSNDISELRETLGAVELFRGKVEDVERRTVGGFARGLGAFGRAWMPIRAACSMCVSRTNSLLPSAMGKWCARHPILSPCSIAKRSLPSQVRP